MDERPENTPLPPGPLPTFSLGLKVLGSELKWLAIASLRRLEIRQLQKRVDEEYRELGRLTEAAETGDEKAAILADQAVKQVEFLKEELAHLHQDLEGKRQTFVAERLEKWNLAPRAK